MIHGGYHGYNGFSVCKCKHGNLRSAQKFFYNYFRAAFTEALFLHDGANRGFCLFKALGDDNALAESKSVGFDDGGIFRALKVCDRLGGVVENLIRRRGNTVFFHEIFCKNLAALNCRSSLIRTEAGYAGIVQSVDCAEHKRVVRGNNGKINAVFNGETHLRVYILCAYINAYGVARNAAVSRQSVYFTDPAALFQLFDYGVLAPAAADHHYFHTFADPFACRF